MKTKEVVVELVLTGSGDRSGTRPLSHVFKNQEGEGCRALPLAGDKTYVRA